MKFSTGLFALVLLALPVTALCAGAEAPSVDTLKQTLERKLLTLKTGGATERQVLFQEVRAGAPSGGRYPFQVTALIRDYGPGFPANNFFGQTCVGQIDKWTFTLWRDAFGDWQVDGRMTVQGSDCKPNPSAGVSSMPLAGLAGSPASAAPPQAQKRDGAPAAAAVAKGATLGSYACWHFTRARLDLNFTLQAGGHYIDAARQPGSYTYEAGTGKMNFRGAGLDGQTALFHVPSGRPTVSFRNNRGEELDFCQLAG